ncbi:MAG TPA: CDP-alcohol phosphatidyltransferase family protein [Pengzhenrongella sp.]
MTDIDGGEVAREELVSGRVLTVPNLISFGRLALVPVFAVLIVQGEDVWALGVLAVSGASDWLDGVIARRFHQVSRLGQLLDPAADRLFILVTLIGLSLRDVVPLWLVIVLVSRDVLLLCLLPLLARHGYGPLPVHFAGKAGTFALLYAFPLLLLAEWSGPVGTFASALGWAFAWWGVVLYWLAALLYFAQARTLLRPRRVAA